MLDPIALGAQAREVAETLHKRNDIVVRLKTNQSGYAEDALDAIEIEEPGHFKADKNVLTLNLDKLVGKNKKAGLTSLKSVEDFRQYPVLAGVLAHESGHARFTLWNDLPEAIPNPEYDPTFIPGASIPKKTDDPRYIPGISPAHDAMTDKEWFDDKGPGKHIKPDIRTIESFPVSGNGRLMNLASDLEEPRVERLGKHHFTKTWKRAMELSAGHLVLESVADNDDSEMSPLDAAVSLAITVGGRLTAGTLGTSFESRAAANKVLASAQKIIEESIDDTPDPYHAIMGIINDHVFNDDHDDAVPHLEAARQILKIVHPEEAENPDGAGGPNGRGDSEEEGEGGEGAALSGTLADMAKDLDKALEAFADTQQKEVFKDEDQPEKGGSGGHGAVHYNNEKAPKISHYEAPNADDRNLYKLAAKWMMDQIESTSSVKEQGQWLPTGGARLDVRSFIRDNMAGHVGNQRSDWNRDVETVKPAPPVKFGIMLDGSGSMHAMARPSASIAWAAANAAADLPEARTASVIFGAAAALTQAPGHAAPRQLAVSNTDAGWENFTEGAAILEQALRLDDATEEGEKSNTVILIVSDLSYGGGGQREGFIRITKDWHERGYRTLVVGTRAQKGYTDYVEVVSPTELFKS